jgi:hypothetical protein
MSCCFHSQLILVDADGMQVGADDCRFSRSYLWFGIVDRRNYFWLKIALNAGRSVFGCRSLQLA